MEIGAVIQITPQMRILVAVEPADFRKGIDGLAQLCRTALERDPFSGTVFVFRSRSGKAIKLLVYDGQGFWLCQKRLSKGRFRFWPTRAPGGARALKVKLRQRHRRPQDQERFEAVVTAITCDLIHRQLTVPGAWVAVSLSKTKLGHRSRYSHPAIGKTLPDILERLATPEMAFVELCKGHQGFFDEARQTTIRAGRRLLTRIKDGGLRCGDFRQCPDEEVIILKDHKQGFWDTSGRMVEYTDDDITCAYRGEVQAINEWLGQADIKLDRWVVDNQAVDGKDRRLRRYFNNRSFQAGGRLFGGFWQPMSKVRRKDSIFIDGESVVTLDYGQMAPRIVYGIAGASPPAGDLYTLPGLEAHREGVKKIMSALLYKTEPPKRFPNGTRKYFPRDIKMAHVMDKIREAHHHIADLLFSGVGFEVFFRESEILVDVLLALKQIGITALPIHDAVVVKQSAADAAAQVMKSIFTQHTGLPGHVGLEA